MNKAYGLCILLKANKAEFVFFYCFFIILWYWTMVIVYICSISWLLTDRSHGEMKVINVKSEQNIKKTVIFSQWSKAVILFVWSGEITWSTNLHAYVEACISICNSFNFNILKLHKWKNLNIVAIVYLGIYDERVL